MSKVRIDNIDLVALFPYEVRALHCLLNKFVELGLVNSTSEVIKRICGLTESEAVMLSDKLTKYSIDSYTGDYVKLYKGQKVWTLADEPAEATILDIVNGVVYYTESINGYQGSKTTHVFSTREAAKAMFNSIEHNTQLNPYV